MDSVHDSPSFHVVGMGGSAGGLKAFEQFFSNLPSDTGMAYILLQHLDPTHKCLLPELIQRMTKMKVFQIEDGMEVQPDCVHVIPPNKDLSIKHGILRLSELPVPSGLRMPIDTFFIALAEDQGEKSIGIIFSGTGTDGTMGIKAIKEKFGMVMAQDPDTSEFSSMPSSAVSTHLVDYVTPAEALPVKLMAYVKQNRKKTNNDETAIIDNNANALQKIFSLLTNQTGHNFSLYKKNTIYRRIERRMNIHQLDKIPRYVNYLQQNPAEVDLLFNELLIGVTSFFREPEAFEYLKSR